MIATAPAGLDTGQRSTLERIVIRARAELEHDLAEQAEGRFGIHINGTIEEEDALPDDSDRISRRELEQILAHLRALGEDAPGAVARLLREATFTHLNRLVAIRIAESIGLLPESLAQGRQSAGFRDLGEIMPMLAGDYRAYLHLCGDELAVDAPALFDPRNPLLTLEPSTAAFDELVALLADPAANDVWQAPDALGWTYQFFNTGEERRAMRESSTPRNSRELAVRNQFFTPRYVVDFLVQNTIGRRLVENDPVSPLLDDLPLLVDPPIERGPALSLDNVKCLDPACGSGHFLLGCYDVLERAWELAGVAPSESAPKIVASLWGVDIDVRCAQVASAAIVLRARRSCRDLPLPRPNIITARGLPGGSGALPSNVDLTEDQERLVDRVSEVLDSAPVLGPLLKAEVALAQQIRHGLFEGRADTLSLTDVAAEATERELLSHLQAIADQASSSVAERLLAAEANDALRLIDMMRQRYDAVLMNPPFGEPALGTKPYLRAAYASLPSSCDLFSAFVERGLDLCKADGYLGAITSRAGMFLTTFENWRRDILLGNRLMALADLGYGVMEQAMVEAAAYVIGSGAPAGDPEATFVRLLKEPDRAAALAEAISANLEAVDDGRIFKVRLSDLQAIPGAPVAYWMNPSIRRLFVDLPPMEGNGADVRAGLCTGDDFRFIRCSWEVAPDRSIGPNSAAGRWAPFAKGGEYSPFWSDIHLVVDWGREGANIAEAEAPGTRVQNSRYYFRPGVTWPLRTQGGFNPRLLPAGCIFGHKGPGLFAADDDTATAMLGWLMSRPAIALLASTATFGAYEVGLVQRLPWPGQTLNSTALAEVLRATRAIVGRRADEDAADETTRRFRGPRVPKPTATLREAALDRSLEHTRGVVASSIDALAIERVLVDALDLDSGALRYLDEEVGPLPANYPDLPIAASSAFAAAFTRQQGENLVEDDDGAATPSTARLFISDRSFETLAHSFQRHPAALLRTQEERGLLPEGEPRQLAEDMLSYLLGVAFGRWDVRIGRDPSLSPPLPGLFNPVPGCPPGMLVGSDGMPATDPPAGYPLELPPTGLLIDEPGHRWDVQAAVERCAAALLHDPAAIVTELLQILGRNTIRDHLRSQFFRDHLSRYSRSRRKAPIYWPLTVPSKTWGVWIYAPLITRETLYAVAAEAGRRERLAGEAITRLQREQHEGHADRSARLVAEELEGEERMAEELRRFRAEAERIAGLGWKPDLDDGIVLCAAPLASLFPSWPEAETARADLRKGKYKWATVAAWADQL